MSILGSTVRSVNEGGNLPLSNEGEIVPSKTSEVSRKLFSKVFTESEEAAVDIIPPSRSLLTKLEEFHYIRNRELFGISLAKAVGADTIVRHREILEEIESKINYQKRKNKQSLVARVYALSDPYSHSVVHLEDDISTFSIPVPLGIIYEVRRVRDRYFFIVHNSGIEFIDNEYYKRLHGDVRVIDEYGVQYGKTSVTIEVPMCALTWQFFDELPFLGYKAVVTHLLDSGKGVIQVSDVEKNAQEYLRQKHAKSHVGLLENEIKDTTRAIETLRIIQEEEANNEADQLAKQLSEQLRQKQELLKSRQFLNRTTFATIHELSKNRISISNDASIGRLQVADTVIECSRKGPELILAPEAVRRQLEIHTLRQFSSHAYHDLRSLADVRIQVLSAKAADEAHLEEKKCSRLIVQDPPQSEIPKKLPRKEAGIEIKVVYKAQPRQEPLLWRVISDVANRLFSIVNTLFSKLFNRDLYTPRFVRPIVSYSAVTSLPSLFVNIGLKKYIANALCKSRQDELHAHFDGTQSDLIVHKLEYAARFQKKFQHLVDDPEGLDRIVRHREICKEINKQDLDSLVRRVNALSSSSSPQVVHLANGGASFSFSGGCWEHVVTYEIRFEDNEYYLVIHNRGFGGDDPDLHGQLTIKAASGVRYVKACVPIRVPKNKLNKELFAVLLDSKLDKTMERAYGYIKEHLLEPDGANIKRSNEEIEATIHYVQKKIMRDEVVRIFHILTSKSDLLQRLQELPQESFVKNLQLSTHERLLQELQMLQELVKNSEFPLFTQEEHQQILQLIEPNQELIDLLKAVITRSTPFLLESELPNTILKTDDTFSSDQSYSTCTESSYAGPEKQMASSNTRRMLKLYTIQELAEMLKRSDDQVPDPQDIKDLLRLGEYRQAHLWNKIVINTKNLENI